MSPKIIKIGKKEDMASVIQKLRKTKETEVLLEFEENSQVLSRKNNIQLIERTAEVLSKQVTIKSLGDTIALPREKPRAQFIRPAPPMHLGRTFSDITPRTRPGLIGSVKGLPKVAEKLIPKIGFLSKRKIYIKRGIFGLVALILIGAVLNLILPRADITVYARSEPISRDFEITVDKNTQSANPDHLIMPGQVMVRELSQTKNFPTTGTNAVGTKASGEVTIHNFTKNTLTLRASTTTLVVNDKKFVFAKDATGIRPTIKLASGEVDLVSLVPPIPIVADTAGESYNLQAGTKFAISNKALGNRPEVYAINQIALTGGKATATPILTQADINKASASLTDQIIAQAQADLKAQDPSADTQLLATGSNKEILAQTANKNVGDQTDNFDMTMIARVGALTFKQVDIQTIVINKVNAVLSSDKYLVSGAKQNLTAQFKSVDLTAGQGVLAVHFETVAAYKVDTDNLSKVLAGKNASEIKEILLSKPEIDQVDVKFSPFWVTSAPKYNGKVYIKSVLSDL